MESIVSTVAAEVNKQLAARQHQEALQRAATSQTSEINTARMVNDAISEAHSRITGEPHLLPTFALYKLLVTLYAVWRFPLFFYLQH